MTEEELPAGEYAIVECLGHRTLVGRISEVERFGTKLMAIEPLFDGKLLPAVMVGGASIYAFTPCTAAVALRHQPRSEWDMPSSLRATLQPLALPAPDDDEDDWVSDAPDFLKDEFGGEHG